MRSLRMNIESKPYNPRAGAKGIKLLRLFTLLMTLIVGYTSVMAGQYTNRFHLKVEAMGETLQNDPVEAFNSGIDNAMSTARSQGEGYLTGYAESFDAVYNSGWVKQEANLQVVDLEVLNYEFNRISGSNVRTRILADMTLEYLDIPMFMEDYGKNVMGASYRAMAFPGWGQFYNREYTTGILYGIAFWSFYALFVNNVQSANTSQRLDDATLNFQVPAIIFWAFNLSEAATSRYLGHQGLQNLAKAYRFEPRFDYEPRTERGFKIDFILFQAPIYKLWTD